jgi:hypothetical protein
MVAVAVIALGVWGCKESNHPLDSKSDRLNLKLEKDDKILVHNLSTLTNGLTAVYSMRLSDDSVVNVEALLSGDTAYISTEFTASNSCTINYKGLFVTDGFSFDNSVSGEVSASVNNSQTKKWVIGFVPGGPPEVHTPTDVEFRCDCEGAAAFQLVPSGQSSKECGIGISGSREIVCQNLSCPSECGCRLRAWISAYSASNSIYRSVLGFEAEYLVFNGVLHQ